MSPLYVRPAASDALIEPIDCHAAHFATRWLRPSLAMISAHGELDAANAQEFVDYALRHADRIDCLVLDLPDVDFFGTAGFSALHTLNARCAPEKSTGSCAQPGRQPAAANLRSGPDVTDLRLRPGRTAAVQGEPRRLLQLVAQPR